MKIRNKHLSPLGFGTITVLPDSVSGELPREFTPSHPLLKFYASKGWIEVIGENAVKPATQPVNVNVPVVPPAGGTGENEDDDGGENAPANLEKRLKEISKMNLDPLREEATKLSIEYPQDATRAVLIDLITKKLQAEQG